MDSPPRSATRQPPVPGHHPALEMQLEGEMQPMDPDVDMGYNPRADLLVHQHFFNDFGDDFDDDDLN
ncbi:hypothetical protein SPRG_04634 [Saprolegnia parasitica CBS 223.65]|uniref:Uncharacterized protein n=1 Tax=Saprolegnia parasitica (strain CBS 223.65) TaxID=695850 RepID=A0A067CJS2_SAPPC|nr:hypothetical protein SPRG_04634 [Saprolegnia parasitica CBS 223.65]KDO30733.1 hypothetical protein SPRG_04634 [Saprolegnia parasitica CBS 223.65]|eukprot:XP_012198433.1 hypothetical protein SPRG_04634 [Saprolegnia parasitica CBS 223.65]